MFSPSVDCCFLLVRDRFASQQFLAGLPYVFTGKDGVMVLVDKKLWLAKLFQIVFLKII